MQEYDIKKGHAKALEGKGLENIMKSIFGSAKADGNFLVSSYGALDELRVAMKSKSILEVETRMRADVDDKIASETIRLYNDFLLEATGFTSKERKKKLNEKLKKGKM